VVKQSAGMDSYELINNFVDVDTLGVMNAHYSDKTESRVSPMLFLRQVLILRKKGKRPFCLTTAYGQRTPNYQQLSDVRIEIPVRLFGSFHEIV